MPNSATPALSITGANYSRGPGRVCLRPSPTTIPAPTSRPTTSSWPGASSGAVAPAPMPGRSYAGTRRRTGRGGGRPRYRPAASQVFTHPGAVPARFAKLLFRALERYLLWQQLTLAGSDTRYDGGFGLYEAPEPWGPWSTVFFTDQLGYRPRRFGPFQCQVDRRGGK